MTRFARFFDRLSRNDQMRDLSSNTKMTSAQVAHRVYRDIYYI